MVVVPTAGSWDKHNLHLYEVSEPTVVEVCFTLCGRFNFFLVIGTPNRKKRQIVYKLKYTKVPMSDHKQLLVSFKVSVEA